MAGFVKDVVTASRSSAAAGTTARTVTIANAPAAGNLVVLHHVCNQVPTSVTDTKGNTWTKAVSKQNVDGVSQWYTMQDGGTLAVGDVITITTATNIFADACKVEEYSGIQAATPLDKTASASISATTARNAGTTATTAQADEVVIATFGVNANETSFTQGSGYSVSTNPYINNSNNTISIASEYEVVNATGTFAPTATGGVSASGAGLVATYKATSAVRQISGAVSATSTVSGNVGAKRPIPVAAISATSTVTGRVSGKRRITSGLVSATSIITGSVSIKGKIRPIGGIFATSTVTGSGGPAPGGAATAGFGISTFGVGTFGSTGIPVTPPSPPTGGGGGGGAGGTGTPRQPTIVPASTPTGDAIIDFIENSPSGLFPENDESNFGFVIRGLWAGKVEDLISQQDLLYKERFASTSELFIDEWERQAGTPAEPAGFDLTTRRAIVLGRIRKGPFTHAARREIVERYLSATFGGGVEFSPSGIPITASGINLASAGIVPDLTTAYKIVEDIPNFTYHVYILNVYTPAAGMARELTRVTPAHINFDISYVATLP